MHRGWLRFGSDTALCLEFEIMKTVEELKQDFLEREDKGEILLCVILTGESSRLEDKPDAVLVMKLNGWGGAIVYGYIEDRDEWIANWGERYVISHLLNCKIGAPPKKQEDKVQASLFGD